MKFFASGDRSFWAFVHLASRPFNSEELGLRLFDSAGNQRIVEEEARKQRKRSEYS